MIRNYEKYNNLLIQDIHYRTLKSSEDRGGYLDIFEVDDDRLHPVIVPVTPGGYKEKYCGEY